MNKNITITLLLLFIAWVWVKPIIETWHYMYYESTAHICWYDASGGFEAKNNGIIKINGWDWRYLQPTYHTECPND